MIIQLGDIVADQRAQPRTAIAPERVEEYAADMERGDKFPPLVVFREGAKFWLADGFHRYYAAVAFGSKSFECYVKDGTLRDAILHSCSANAAHGLRRTNDDKKRAVAKLLADSEWSAWSSSEIARHCAVSHTFVDKVRREIAAFSPATVAGEAVRFVNRHGTESEMRPARKPEEKPADGALVAKWLREIERHLELMPAEPVKALGAFPADQRYLFPLSKLEWMAHWLAEFAAAWRRNIEDSTHETDRRSA